MSSHKRLSEFSDWDRDQDQWGMLLSAWSKGTQARVLINQDQKPCSFVLVVYTVFLICMDIFSSAAFSSISPAFREFEKLGCYAVSEIRVLRSSESHLCHAAMMCCGFQVRAQQSSILEFDRLNILLKTKCQDTRSAWLLAVCGSISFDALS